MRRISLLLLLACAWLPVQLALSEDPAPVVVPHVLLLEINGAIGPATSHYISQGIKRAAKQGSAVVILRMDTPGGLDTAMRDIVKDILASSVPVVTFVSPSGARAASAGTYILYASHIAAMAPATNLGSATPVQIGGEPESPKPAGDEKPEVQKPGEEPKPAVTPGNAMERKVVNDAVAYLRGLAQLRGRNIEWAEKAVREGANLPANDALEQKIIDVIATDEADLLAKIHGRKLKVGAGEVTLATQGLIVETLKPDWRTELLSVITNPTVAYGLLLIGIYGLLFEGYNPGAVLPGVAGVICLLLALFAFQVLPVNYAGLALIGLGAALVVAEAYVPSFGTLGIGGLIAFIIGSIMLFDTTVPGFDVAMPIIGGIAFVGGLVMFGIVWMFGRARRQAVVTGVETIVGSTAEAVGDFSGKGTVRLGGELWNAQSPAPVRAGQRVRVVKVEGLLLRVEPL